MALGKSGKGMRKHKNEIECENSYCRLAGKNTALNIHLHTHPFMQFMALALKSPNTVDFK